MALRGILGGPGDALEAMAAPFAAEAEAVDRAPGHAWGRVGPRTTLVEVDGARALLMGRPRLAGDGDLGAVARRMLRLWRADRDWLPVEMQGAFAFALVDPGRREALLAVDRAGAEALAWALTDEGPVFATRADAVAAHPRLGAELDLQGIYNYLFFEKVPSPGTVFRGVSKLRPAEYLRWRGGKVEQGFYWQMPYVDRGGDFEALREEFHGVLDRSVARAAEGTDKDQGGAFLSGGIDSSTVCGELARLVWRPTDAFSIGFSAEGYDEMAYARLAARHFGLRHHNYYVTPADVLQLVPRIAAAYDEPFGNASAVPTYYCARLAVDQGKAVLIAGDGGDEIFGGNSRYAHQLLFEHYARVPVLLRHGLLEPLARLPGAARLFPLRKLRSYIEQARVPLPDRMESYNFLRRTPLEQALTPEFLAAIDPEGPLDNLREVYFRAASQDPLQRMLHLDIKITLADSDLRKVNRMCDLAGVEVRYPLLDDEMLDFSGRVPPALKIKKGRLRWFFKESVRGFLPDEILAKKKHGFGLPTGVWLRDDPDLAAHAIARLEALEARGWVRPEFIREQVRRMREEHAGYYGVMVWILMMLEEWLQAHGR